MGKKVHLIFRDIFSAAYINFMVNSMNEYEHLFIMKSKAKIFRTGIKSNKADDIIVDDGVQLILIDEDREIIENDVIKEHILQAEQFIISGLFDDLSYVLQYGDEVWDKTYLHFWGGDFYCFREENFRNVSEKRIKDKELLIKAIERCAAVCNVVGTDYDIMREILKIDKLHFEAPMPEQLLLPANENDEQDIDKNRPLRLVIGNSASSDNCHIDLFEKIKWLADENVVIFCPVSYGETIYREEVILAGKKIFGDKIIFLTEFVPYEQYIKFLQSCDIGIYNNNRQQGFKNITTMLCLGKKVFIRENTAVHRKLQELGVDVNVISDIIPNDLSIFDRLSENCQLNNRQLIESYFASYKGLWEYVLNKKSRRTLWVRKNNSVPLSIHITDHCNLNCKGCSHFAPVAEEYYISIDEFEDTLNKIKTAGEDLFSEFCIMGGEPLLHPDICTLLTLSRTYLSRMTIKLITNGLLVMELSDEIWEKCKEYDISVEITYYPIGLDYEIITDYLRRKGVKTEIYVDRRNGDFRRDCINHKNNMNRFWNYSKCRIGGVYPQVRNGSLFRCATAANIHIINAAFGTEFKYEEADYLPFELIKSKNDLRHFLLTPSAFCRYCDISKQCMGKWEVSRKEKSEWLGSP